MRLRAFGGMWIEHPGADSGAKPRPRPLALLAILAVAGAKGTTRDRILGVLWPDTEEERALGQGEFAGGCLRLFPHGLDAKSIDVSARRGTLVAFLASIPHEVTPVTRGRRDTIIDWCY